MNPTHHVPRTTPGVGCTAVRPDCTIKEEV